MPPRNKIIRDQGELSLFPRKPELRRRRPAPLFATGSDGRPIGFGRDNGIINVRPGETVILTNQAEALIAESEAAREALRADLAAAHEPEQPKPNN